MNRKTNGSAGAGAEPAAMGEAVPERAPEHERLGVMEFPCRFPIKAMGRQSAEFEPAVTEIVLRHAQLWPEEPIRSTPSKAGRFVSVTAVIEAVSQEQLDAIYSDLTDCALVLVAL